MAGSIGSKGIGPAEIETAIHARETTNLGGESNTVNVNLLKKTKVQAQLPQLM